MVHCRLVGLSKELEYEAEALAAEWLAADTALSLDEYLLKHAGEELKRELAKHIPNDEG